MRITSKGQVTIPIEIREKAGLLPNTEVEFVYDGKTVTLVRAKSVKKAGRGAQIVAHLSGAADVDLGMTTDEIMQMLRGD